MRKDLYLRDVLTGDLPIFFEHQLDLEANYMAAFTAQDPANQKAFAAHWKKILADATVIIKTIIWEGQVVGTLGGATPAGPAFAMLAAAAGAAFRDRPTVISALALVAAVVTVSLLVQGLATRILARLDAAVAEREALQAGLAAAHKTQEAFRTSPITTTSPGCPTAVCCTTCSASRSRTRIARRATSPCSFSTSTTSRQ